MHGRDMRPGPPSPTGGPSPVRDAVPADTPEPECKDPALVLLGRLRLELQAQLVELVAVDR